MMSRIIIFDQYPFMGGAQTVLLSVVSTALELFETVIVAAPGGGGVEAAIASQFGSTVHFVPIPQIDLSHGDKGLSDVFRLLMIGSLVLGKVQRLIRDDDLIYVNGPRLFLPLMLLSLWRGRAFIYHVHLEHTALAKMLIVLASRLRRTRKIIAVSPFVLRGLKRFGGYFIRQGRLTLAENALDPRYAGRAFVNRFAGDGRMQIAVIGVLRPEKGQDQAVALARRLPGVDIHCLGRIAAGQQLWADNLRKSAPTNVTFHEAVSDVPAFLDSFGIQIVLVPSQGIESFGLTAIEGMACSCISIVRNAGALADIAACTGALSYDGSDADLEEVMRAVLKRPKAELTDLARRQHQACQDQYSPDKFRCNIARLMLDE